MNLIVKELDEAQVKEFFPALYENGYQYRVELSALTPYGKKSLDSGYLSACRWKEQTLDGRTFIIRELSPYDIPCVRVQLDKPMRESQREKIYSEIVIKMNEKIERCGLAENHPYRLILK